jgi:hypothetical protein
VVDEFVVRIGTFCILIGVGILILFAASDYAGSTNFDLLFWAVFSMTLGILLRRRRAPSPDSGRFASLRKLRGPTRDRKDGR